MTYGGWKMKLKCAKKYLPETSGMQPLSLSGRISVKSLPTLNPPFQRLSDLPWPSRQARSDEIARGWDQSAKALEYRSSAGILCTALIRRGPDVPIDTWVKRRGKSYGRLGFEMWDLSEDVQTGDA